MKNDKFVEFTNFLSLSDFRLTEYDEIMLI